MERECVRGKAREREPEREWEGERERECPRDVFASRDYGLFFFFFSICCCSTPVTQPKRKTDFGCVVALF